jgi:hypothetical protein
MANSIESYGGLNGLRFAGKGATSRAQPNSSKKQKNSLAGAARATFLAWEGQAVVASAPATNRLRR